jgi:hypothetical protein
MREKQCGAGFNPALHSRKKTHTIKSRPERIDMANFPTSDHRQKDLRPGLVFNYQFRKDHLRAIE